MNISQVTTSVPTGVLSDVISGGSGRDNINSGKGDDTIRGGDGRDVGYGGPGTDHCTSVEVEQACE